MSRKATRETGNDVLCAKTVYGTKVINCTESNNITLKDKIS